MFDIAPTELMIVALVAIVLIGPKDLPRVMRVVGQWVGKGRTMMRHVHGAVDEMIREAEVQESVGKWATENTRILADHSAVVAEPLVSGETTLATAPATERLPLAFSRG